MWAWRPRGVRSHRNMRLVIKGKNMTEAQAVKSKRASAGKAAVGRLFVLDLSDGCVLSMNLDGSDRKIIASKCRYPDGVAVDVEAGHVYWANMGVPNLNDGSIERADIDGNNRKFIIPKGGTFTPKQLHLDKKGGKLYWSDREGPPRGNTVNRVSVDAKPKQGTPEIVLTHLMEGIGIALDVPGDRMFLTDFGGSIYCAKLDGSEERVLLYAQGNLTGIAYAKMNSKEN